MLVWGVFVSVCVCECVGESGCVEEDVEGGVGKACPGQ